MDGSKRRVFCKGRSEFNRYSFSRKKTMMRKLNFYPFPLLKTPRLILRQLTDSDADAIYSLRSDNQVNKYIDRPKPAGIDDAKAFILKINSFIEKNESLYWAICLKDTSELIGTV